jgi:SnoaL-like domain
MDDVELIKQLKARYFRMMDTKDWDGVAAVFADDVQIDMRGEGATEVQSLGEFVPYLIASVGAVTTVHHGHMPEIEITSPTTASGVWAMEDMLWWPDGSRIRHLHGYGHYHETYRKVGDEWRIASMRLTRLRRDIDFA